MTTSGVYNLNQTAADLIQESLDLLQVAADGETISTSLTNRSLTTLNIMLKEWQAQGLHLWTYTEGSLFLKKGVPDYDFSTARVVNDFSQTTLSADASATDTVITVSDSSIFSDGDAIGVIQDDLDAFWTTVNGAPVGDSVTLTDPLTQDAASGNVVFQYDPAVDFIPVSRIRDDIRRFDARNQFEIRVSTESRKDYFQLPDKFQEGAPVIAYYSRQNTASKNDAGVMTVWDAPDTSNWVMNFTYERQLEIITADTQNVDFPEYYNSAIVYGLANRLKTKLGASPALSQELSVKADETLQQALAYDNAVYDFEVRLGYLE